MPKNIRSRPTPSFPVQFLAGFISALVLASLVAIAAMRQMISGRTPWIAAFILLWVAVFVAIRKKWITVVVGLVIGSFVGYLLGRWLLQF